MLLLLVEALGKAIRTAEQGHGRFEEGTFPLCRQGQNSSPEEDSGGQEDGRAEDVGAAVVAGCKTPPALQSGKERLDFVTPATQPLAVMH